MKKNFLIAISLAASISLSCSKIWGEDLLRFNSKNYKTQTLSYNGKEFKVRAYEKIIYVRNPVDTNYQVMNIYIPEEYFNNGSVNGYTAETAPIFYPNQVGGYMPATPASIMSGGFRPMNGGGNPPKDRPDNNNRPPMPGGDNNRPDFKDKPDMPMPGGGEGAPMGGEPNNGGGQQGSALTIALSKGYVVASAGARGRSNVDANGKYYGKAPAGLIDLKAGIRYLKYNDAEMPGDANKIISNGTSAGGAMSALLGATGDNADYLPYLEEIGACETSDAIYASSDYCPITNLDHADAAYEWQFFGVNSIQNRGSDSESKTETTSDEQNQVSADLKSQFPDYVNSLNLKDENGNPLTLDKDGNGSFKEFMKAKIIESANIAIKGGQDLSNRTFLTIKNGIVTNIDWNKYVQYMERQKTPPAFDGLNLSTPENAEFGTETINTQHFTNYSQQHSAVNQSTMADEKIVKMMNPMYYIGSNDSKTAKYWRIRHGSKDKDTGLAISAILATYLQNNGCQVDYALPWDKPHGGDYDLPELFEWMDSICK